MNKSYFQTVTPFQPGDTVNLSLNVLSKDKKVFENNFKWMKFKVEDLPTLDLSYFDGNRVDVRYSEMEILKNRWSDLAKLNKKEEQLKILGTIKAMFEPIFAVKAIQFDHIGYQLLKITLLAVKEGKVEQHREIGIRLAVKSGEVENEVKRAGLINERSNLLNLRKGDTLVFYISRHYQA